MDFALTLVGLALLVVAGDALVRGAVGLALKLEIPVLIISLTVVAFGTSAPELVVGVQAALDDADGIVMGNIVGSNIANVLLVLGVPALVSSINPAQCDTRREWLAMMAASVLFIALCLIGPLQWWGGAILLTGLALMLGAAYREARSAQADAAAAALPDEIAAADPTMPYWKLGLLLGVGVLGLPLGAHLLVEGARAIAEDFGLSEAAIGLTLVAVGTSLPELATTVAAAVRRHAEVAIGNVVGSNLFNLLGIMGLVGFFGPIEVPPEFLRMDLWVMLACGALLWFWVFPRRVLGRRTGIGLLALYALYGFVVLGPRM
jgi:cation:H+ antiporter